jgi:hypothetical protein
VGSAAGLAGRTAERADTDMYTLTLLLHSWVRWAVLIAGIAAAGRALVGWFRGQPWSKADRAVGAAFVGFLDLQFLLGLLLYFALSPITKEAMRDFGAVMANAALRYWAVEHAFGMLVGVALAHIGLARIKKMPESPRRHRTAAIFFTLALLIIIASVPWPGGAQGRPLLRW